MRRMKKCGAFFLHKNFRMRSVTVVLKKKTESSIETHVYWFIGLQVY